MTTVFCKRRVLIVDFIVLQHQYRMELIFLFYFCSGFANYYGHDFRLFVPHLFKLLAVVVSFLHTAWGLLTQTLSTSSGKSSIQSLRTTFRGELFGVDEYYCLSFWSYSILFTLIIIIQLHQVRNSVIISNSIIIGWI